MTRVRWKAQLGKLPRMDRLYWDDRDGICSFERGQLFQLVSNYGSAAERRKLGKILVELYNQLPNG